MISPHPPGDLLEGGDLLTTKNIDLGAYSKGWWLIRARGLNRELTVLKYQKIRKQFVTYSFSQKRAEWIPSLQLQITVAEGGHKTSGQNLSN